MNARPVAQACPSCGAPLSLDADGRCRSCRAQHWVSMPSGPIAQRHPGRHEDPRDQVPFGLVPLHLNQGGGAPFISDLFSALERLSSDNAVQQYTSANPDAHRAIRALAAAVAKAGNRVRDSGRISIQAEDLRLYTPEEIWLVDLAIDVVAMLATGGGIKPDNRNMVLYYLRCIGKHADGRHWEHQVRKAADGPAAFHDLRARVPRRR